MSIKQRVQGGLAALLVVATSLLGLAFIQTHTGGGGSGGGSMVYPAAGVANSTGSAWAASYTVGTGASNLVQLNGSSQLPAVDGSQLTSTNKICVLNQQGAVGLNNTSFTTVASCTLPANLLATTGTCVRATAYFHGTGTEVSTNYQWKFGATATASITDSATTNTQETFRASVCSSGANAQQMVAEAPSHGSSLFAAPAQVSPAETTSGTIVLLLQGQCTTSCSSSDVVDTLTVEVIH